jgi:hypothetical protein
MTDNLYLLLICLNKVIYLSNHEYFVNSDTFKEGNIIIPFLLIYSFTTVSKVLNNLTILFK